MGDRRVCNGEYKCEPSGTNKRLVPDHIDRRVKSRSSSVTSGARTGTLVCPEDFRRWDPSGGRRRRPKGGEANQE